MSESPIEQLLAVLYAAPLQPQLWDGFLARLSSMTDIVGATVIAHDNARMEHKVIATCGDEISASAAPYEEHFAELDLWAKRVQAAELQSGVVIGETIWPLAEMRRSEFFNDFLKPLGIANVAAVGSVTSQTRFDTLNIYPRRDRDIDPSAFRLMKTLQPHIQNALTLRRTLNGLEVRLADLENALDRIAVGIVLLDRDGRCLLLNRAASRLLDARDGLLLDQGMLTAMTTAESASLRRMIQSATTGVLTLDDRHHGMLISRREKRALSVRVARLSAEAALTTPRAVAVVFLNDPEERAPVPPETLALLYGLTPAEARLALSLLNGHSIAEAAANHNISEQTARYQLKRVFHKTNTRRQGELIRLLAATVGPTPG